MKYTIIGNSFASVFAVESIRKTDSKGEIRLISEEEGPAYSPAMLHEYLSGVASKGLLYLRPSDFYEKNGVEAILGSRVDKVDAAARTLSMGRKKLEFKKLLIAAGMTPFVPPGIKGLSGFDNVFTFTRKTSADSMLRKIKGVDSAVVLGGGLIGLQCAEGLAHAGIKVTVVELADNILPLALDDDAAGMVLEELRQEGVNVITGNTIVQINGRKGKIESVTLRSGEKIKCGMVVVAVGVRPNVDFLKDSGIKIDRGILVDERMRTNIKDIYAAGDCAQGLEILSGKKMPIPIIPIATKQGSVAGYNMAGKNEIYPGGLSLNALQFGGLQVVSYGFVRDEEKAEVLKDRDHQGNRYKKIILKDGRISGVILLRHIERAGLFRYLIENKTVVEGFKENLMLWNFGVAHLPKDVRDAMFTRPV
ncbi:MAG: NAD(P)/FAD-dependent oxidoreductase [Nitrospinae bacterium]|nr:NAD(P)/FAD-dependent oxidoreductase [Nitrospinota bacterium]